MRTAHVPDRAGDVRRQLADPRALCQRLGIADGAKPQSRGVLICCPWHTERTPSCSVRVADDGTIAVKCFACDASGDALDLIAQAHGLETVRDFAKVLELAADLAGVDLAAPVAARRLPPRIVPSARDYPLASEVASLWHACVTVEDDPEVGTWLQSRGLDPTDVNTFDLARALPPEVTLPRWAFSRWGTWGDSGHRCIVPMFDATGALRSVRARRVVAREDDAPKALPPSGHRLDGLLMACTLGRQLLAHGRLPNFWPAAAELKVVIAEGEPDFLAWATRWPDADLTAPAVLGIVAGSWTVAVAARIPREAKVIVWTHGDAAGEKYSSAIAETLRGRCTVLRGAVG